MEEKEFNNKEFKQTRLIIVLVAIIIVLVFAIGFLLGTKQKDKTLKSVAFIKKFKVFCFDLVFDFSEELMND